MLAPTRAELDLVSGDLDSYLDGRRVSQILNCSGYTAVDLAESEPILARELNQFVPKKLGAWSVNHQVPLVHVSTDYVYDGLRQGLADESAALDPLGVYARTKLAGERYVRHGWTLRTSWLFGDSGKCFPRSLVGNWLNGKPLRVVSDQTGTPTYAKDLAKWMTLLFASAVPFGLFNAGGDEVVTWYQFAEMILEVYRRVHGIDRAVKIEPISTREWPTAAPRPRNTALDSTKLRTALHVAPTAMVTALTAFAQANPPDFFLGP